MRYFLSGTLAPDATCDYVRAAPLYNGKESWARVVAGYYLWWNGTDSWIISTVLGTQGTAYWSRTSPNPSGLYTPQGTATGDATLTLGYHTLSVTGTLSPDAICNYPHAGTHNNLPYYLREDEGFYIFYDTGTTAWYITPELGVLGTDHWILDAGGPTGVYTPVGTNTGDATVAVGEHV